MYKKDLALNNLQWLICHKTKLNQICSTDIIVFKNYTRLVLWISRRKSAKTVKI